MRFTKVYQFTKIYGYYGRRDIQHIDIQHIDTQHNDTQHKGFISNTQHK